jgi:hypothetical protein
MKAKMSLDKKAIQGFFLRHVEKMVLFVIVVVFLGLAYGAATHSSYERKPQELQDAAQRAEDNIEQIKQPVAPDWAKVNPYPEVAKQSRKAVSESTYVWRHAVDTEIWPPVPRRTTPPLFAAEAVKGTAGVGGFLMKAGGSGQQQVGQRWIVVTGLVPAAKQVEAYAETFKDLKRPESDTPRYFHYWVERAEMFGDARDANPNWTQINVLAAKQVQNNWATAPQEAVAATYIHEPLVFPLGPLMTASWGDEVAHPPEIPLASATTSPAPVAAPVAKPGAPASDVPQDMPPGAAKPADLPPTAPATPAAAPGAAAPAAAGGAAVAGAPTGAAAPAGEGETAGEGHGHMADLANVKYLLVRFFDFTVEPGKRYAYRVKLLLKNPNEKVEARYLTDPKLAELTYLETEWSDPSTPVFVPRDDRLLAGPARLLRGEPLATVTLVKWMADRGTESSHQFEISRGKLANLSSEATGVAETEEGSADGALLAPSDEEKPAAKRKKDSSGPTITYRTDALLVDVHGGEKWRGQTTEPAELLLVDYDGRLVVHDELTDQLQIPKPAIPQAEGEVTLDKKDKKDKKGGGDDLFGTSFGDEKKPKKEKPTGKKK